MFAVGPPRSLLLLLFSVSFSVFFISFRFLCAVGRRRKNAKPRPCLMCKKQPSPSAAFVCCLRPNSGSGHGSSSGAHRVGYRRPSNGPWNVFKLRKQLRVLKLSNASKTRMGNGKKCEMLPAQRREELGVASMEKPLQKPLVPGLVWLGSLAHFKAPFTRPSLCLLKRFKLERKKVWNSTLPAGKYWTSSPRPLVLSSRALLIYGKPE